MATKVDLYQDVPSWLPAASVAIAYYDGVSGKAIGQDAGVTNTVIFRSISDNYDLSISSPFIFSFYLTDEVRLRASTLSTSGGETVSGSIQIDAELDSNGDVGISLLTKYRNDFISFNNSRFITTSTLNPQVSAVEDGNFHHVVVRRNYEVGGAVTRFYLDGAEIMSNTDSLDPLIDKLGIFDNLSIELEGKLDHLKIFHQDLTNEELQTILDEI